MTPKDPASGPPSGRAARVSSPGGPVTHLPPRVAGGTTSPQGRRRTAAAAAGKPDPGTGAVHLDRVTAPVRGRTPPGPIAERIKVDPLTGCWHWETVNNNGYGVIHWAGKPRSAHRIIYELLAGPIPDGLELDHLCHPGDGSCSPAICLHRRCVNPAHLEPTIGRENILRGSSPSAQAAKKTHCPKGHEYTHENTRIEADGGRRCRRCEKLRSQEKRGPRKPKEAPEIYGSLIPVKLPSELDTAIRQMAAQEGVAPARFMRQLAQAEVDRHQTSEGEAVA